MSPFDVGAKDGYSANAVRWVAGKLNNISPLVDHLARRPARKSSFTARAGWGLNPAMNTALKSLTLIIGLVATILSPSLTAAEVGTGASFKGPLGLQLYSLRGQFASQGVPATLKQVQAYGFKTVELAGTYNLSPDRFLQLLKEHGLTAVSGHFSYDKYRDDPEAVAQEAKALGLKYAGCAWISHQGGQFNEATTREAARVFNRAGEVLAQHGIQFFYHCHGYEFQPHGDGTLMDLLIQETDPKQVAYQMDVLWVVHPGADPVKYLEKYPDRWQLMHVKDLRKGVEGNFSGGTDVKNDVAIGTGQMNWPAILAAAKKAGVKHYFIEDESPTVVDQIPQSLKFLSEVKF